MTQDDVFEKLKNYFETRSAARWALGLLKPGVEIGLVIGNQIDCAIFNKDSGPCVEKREAQNPSFVFHVKPESIETLANSKSDDISEVGINIFTEIISGNIRVEIKSGLKEILNGGYFEVLKSGGQKLSSFLTTQGAMSMMKLIAFIDKMKNSRSS